MTESHLCSEITRGLKLKTIRALSFYFNKRYSISLEYHINQVRNGLHEITAIDVIVDDDDDDDDNDDE